MTSYPNWTAETDDAIVTHDGIEKFRGTQNECFVYILNHQSQSVSWACKYEGWAVRDAVGINLTK